MTKKFLFGTICSISLFPVGLIYAQQDDDDCPAPGPNGIAISIFRSTSEGTGAKYRKVGMNGFPIPDEKPQQKAETDEEAEETFIDPFSQTLTHQVTDCYIPFQGTDLTLSIRRNWSPEIWNYAGGLKPKPDRHDLPFGPGWRSTLSAGLRFETPYNHESFPNSPAYAYVTDQNGTSYRFLVVAYIPGATVLKFYPLPENRHQQEVLATSLEMISATEYRFTGKYGTKLTFGSRNWVTVVPNPGTNSNPVSTSGTSYTWARLLHAEDRYGTEMTYDFEEENTTLIPDTITCRGKKLTITRDSNGRVTKVKDPRGNETNYEYENFDVYADGPSPVVGRRLKKVVRADDSETVYGYQVGDEADRQPRNPDTFGPFNRYYYMDLSSITDPNENTYSLTYAFDSSRQNFMVESYYMGWYRPCGNPRNITTVTLPGGAITRFHNNSNVWIGPGETHEGTPEGQRIMEVTDSNGGFWKYEFTDATIARVDEFAEFSIPEGSTVARESIGLNILYRKMTVTTPASGQMVATFEPNAGMALKSFKDIGGLTTTFEYTDDFDFSSYLPWLDTYFPGMYTELPTTKWGDPNKQTNGLGDEKLFHFDNRIVSKAWHLMDRITDERENRTSYDIDQWGNRIKEEMEAKQTGGAYTLVQQTDFTYNNFFKGIMTRKEVKTLSGDPAWATSLVTEYELQSTTGNVLKEKVGIAPNQRVTEYTYDANNNKLTTKDPRGNITSFVYDDLNRLTQVNLPGGVNKKIFYDARGNKIREDDELGHSTLREYDGMNRVVKEARDMNGDHAINAGDLITETTYNSLGAKTSVKTPNGWTTSMTYDGLNRLTKTTDPYGKETTFEYGTNSGGLQFGRDFQPVKVVDARGFETLTTYDANFRPIEKKVQYAGLGGSKVYATTKWEYDAVGNVIKEYDPLHTTVTPRITQKTYDALNREIETKWPDLTSNQTYYTSTGLKWKTVDELNNDTLTEYDDAGRPTKVSSPVVDNGFGTNARAITLTSYDAAGNVLTTTNPLGKVWTYTYDNRNRKSTEVRPTAGSPTFKWFYDAVGNVTKTTDALNNSTTTAYDVANRVVEVKQPTVTLFGGGGVQPTVLTEYDANGNATKVTDPNGHETVNVYDKLNRLVTTTDAEGIVVTNEYDEVGNRTAVIDGKSQRTEFEYDGLKRNTKVTDAANKSTTFEYNAVDKTARVDAMGKRTEYLYDIKHRLTNVNYIGRSVDNRIYTYDATNNLLSVTEPDPGKSGMANVEYTYDALKRQLTELSNGLTHTYKYDLAGNRVSVIYGGTPAISLISTYDEENRLSTLTEDTRVTSYSYDKNGNILVKTLPNGDTQTSVFDAINRTKTLTGTSGIGGALYSYAYQFDAASNVKRIVETYPSVALNRIVNNFYDDINRLTEETVNGTSLTVRTYYTYDNANNRATMTKGTVTTNYTYNNLNQLTGFTEGPSRTVSYMYDDNGNRVQRLEGPKTVLYEYDYANRLTLLDAGTTNPEGLNAFMYDYRTRRVFQLRNTGGVIGTKFVFSGGTSVREFANNVHIVDYVRGSDWGGGVGGILYSLRGGVPSFTHYNRRGDVTAKTNASGGITYQSQYEAFGKRTVETGATLDRQKSNTKDEDVPGYANEGFRFRDLETGTFLTRDPAGFIDGPNLYAYVQQNPWTAFDPEGLAMSRGDRTPAKTAAKNRREARNEQRAFLKQLQKENPGAAHQLRRGNVERAMDMMNTTYTMARLRADGELSPGTESAMQTKMQSDVQLAQFLDNGFKDLNRQEFAEAQAPWDLAFAAGSMFIGPGGFAKSGLSLLQKFGRAAEEIAGSARLINPLNGTMNCVNCAEAMDAVLGGVKGVRAELSGAKPISSLGTNWVNVSGQAEIESLLSQGGKGTRGIVYGGNPGEGVGHVWNVANQRSGINFIDAQAGGAGAYNFQNYQTFKLLITNP